MYKSLSRIALTAWLFGSLYCLTYRDFDLFSAFGAVGTLGGALLLSEAGFVLDFGFIEEPPYKEQFLVLVQSKEFWAMLITATATVQWGFASFIPSEGCLTC
ncbi:hypothetical protein [Aestuariicoccus sp. MJ-SS9]|uniref:hypothetical protein n=1 Tax=Aestuariicoccus sp. MJ-SS9 TaxID=3079855 RepID=UPI002914D09F|nr:hypothetical protein [Aestuariicoccus sp. MJ-SS9]MDU8912564.1 hypothetical protein [Aestuariicoccus sp. MJ-SS9]